MQNKIYYFACLSGGKDSSAMVDLLLKNGYPIDYIIFNDTLAEFPAMYEYLAKFNAHLKASYGREITILKPAVSLEDIIFARAKKGKSEGKIKGAFLPQLGFCDWRLRAKIHPLEKFCRDRNIKKSEIRHYIGITTDEPRRANRKDKTKIYPLLDDFKMSEKDCLEYLKSQNLHNPLYDDFSRTGCAFCPAQNKAAKRILFEKYPQIWAQIKEYERKLAELETKGEAVYNKFWFRNKSISEYEKEFSV